MDIYVRMNADAEKDYCLMVKRDGKVKDLMELFQRIPVTLSPNYFYEAMPARFAASVHPGHLTAAGTMLFSEDADQEKHLIPLSDEAVFSEALVEGQLIVPVWRFNNGRWLRLVTFLLAWLYLDLPEHITPTPGVAPSTLVVRSIQRVLPILKDAPDSVDPFDSNYWRWGFFAAHCLKIAFIYLIFRVGVLNPRSLNPWNRQRPREVDQSDLIGLGWTAVRRLPADEWPNLYRDFLIEKYGGILKAHMDGHLDRPTGVDLGRGEGWDGLRETDPKKREVGANFLNKEGKFIVSDKYLSVVAEELSSELVNPELSEEEKLTKLRIFRRYGFFDGPSKLRDLFETVVDQPRDS